MKSLGPIEFVLRFEAVRVTNIMKSRGPIEWLGDVIHVVDVIVVAFVVFFAVLFLFMLLSTSPSDSMIFVLGSIEWVVVAVIVIDCLIVLDCSCCFG